MICGPLETEMTCWLSLQYQIKARLPATGLDKSLAPVGEGECEIAETGGSSSIFYIFTSTRPWAWAQMTTESELHHPWSAQLQHHWLSWAMTDCFANDSLTVSWYFAMIFLLHLCLNKIPQPLRVKDASLIMSLRLHFAKHENIESELNLQQFAFE